jgi:hypothetical protein
MLTERVNEGVKEVVKIRHAGVFCDARTLNAFRKNAAALKVISALKEWYAQIEFFSARIERRAATRLER